ncbi:MAG TPA: glycosyltransferase family 4 protein [Actinomycetota bacterium]|nr:glycosyltransferase family 4 protein [Actinomycetota bacterium]
MNSDPLRIALLTYRGNPHSGGQGVYVRHLTKALMDEGHHVEVFAGPPYPELHDGVPMTRLPSLDLYRPEDPFRVPRPSEFRDAIDVAEFGIMCAAGYPEPLTFSLRAARMLRRRRSEFDIVHDNQSLAYGLLGIERLGLPVVATIHHPCSIDRDHEVAAAPDWKKRLSLKRWYAFTRMQARVARRLQQVITVSAAARDDIRREFGVSESRISVVHNGVDTDLFRPVADIARVPGRVITTASSELPLKGLVFLLEAIAKMRTERDDVHLVVVGKKKPRGAIAAAIARFDLEDAVTFKAGLEWLDLVAEYARAEVAVVPSVYEGFSLPAVEAMSCGVPLVATTGGALPEVVGTEGTAVLVPPGDAGAIAAAVTTLLGDAGLRDRLGAAGRARVLEHFTWRAAAQATIDVYRQAVGRC